MSGDTKEDWVKRVSEWREATSAVPLLVHDEINKSKISPEDTKHGPKSLLFDPLSVQFAMGYKDRRYSLTYDVLKRIPQQLALVAAIIQTRCNQVASFGTPYRLSKSLGYSVRHKNPARTATRGDREFVQSAEAFIYNCGAKEPNKHSPVIRDDFETFLKKIVRDTLMYDQLTFEVVPDNRGLPYEFMAVDASTIRLAASSTELATATNQGRQTTMGLDHVPSAINQNSILSQNFPFRTMKVKNPEIEDVPAYIQLVNGAICSTYTARELAFGVRNPRTDIYVQGYGYSELEQLITIITAHLFAEEYNRRFFMQGCVAGDTEVVTANGIVPIESLVGQEFLCWNGHKFVPSDVVFSGFKQAVHVTLEDGYVITTSPTHKFLVKEEGGELLMLPLTSILEPGFLIARAPNPSGDEDQSTAPYQWLRIKSVHFTMDLVPMYDVRQTDEGHRWSSGGCITSNSAPKGILNFRGDNFTPDQLEAFKRQWRANLEGVENSWRTPIMQAEQGVEWINLHPSNQEMEYAMWMEYLIKITCFTENMPVTMQDGSLKPISKVEPGDLVHTHNGLVRKVKNVQVSTHNGDLYKITAGSVTEATSEHPFLTVKDAALLGADLKPTWRKAKDLRAGTDWLVIPKKSCTGLTLEQVIPDPATRALALENEDHYFIRITAVEVVQFNGLVYNLEVEGEHTYQVNRFAVHNCAVFLIDPAELNFDMHGGVQQTPLFESSQEWKLKASRDRGLKPMLRFIAKLINDSVIAKLDDDFVFDFVGLDELTEQEKLEVNKAKLSAYMTLNEIRRADDLPDVPYGDLVMNPTYTMYVQQSNQMSFQEKQLEASQAAQKPQAAAPQAAPGQEGGEAAPDQGSEPEFADSFTKSLEQARPVLEISVDDENWINLYRDITK